MPMNTSPKYSGEPTAQSVASGLATLGRYGDNYMVHAAEGETMIPKEVFDENPGLKQDLFRQMSMMGIKDPNRYVVGHALNSINPDTGQPEFFFKKIFKVLGKLAPIAAPIIGNMIAPGIGGLIASGLVTKMQGGSWGDVAKSVALSYGASALTSGVSGALGLGPSGTGGIGSFGGGAGGAGTGFLGGLSRGITAPFQAAGNLFESGAQNPLAQGIFGPRGTGTFFSQSVDPSGRFAKGKVGMFPGYKTPEALGRSGLDPVTGRYDYLKDTTPSGPDFLRAGDTQNIRQVSAARRGEDLARNARPAMMDDSGKVFKYTVQGYGEVTPTELVKIRKGYGLARLQIAPDAPQGVYTQGQGGFRTGTWDGRKYIIDPAGNMRFAQAPAKAEPKLWEGFGGETAAKIASQSVLPLAFAGAAYLLSPEEETAAQRVAALDATNPRRVAYDKWQGIEDKTSEAAMALKNEWYGVSQYSAAELRSKFGANPISGITNLAALGGEITGPGTGTSDSIPARLSDGEFVMTARAVRNAGNGDRDVGAARMYDMMNRFERGAA